MSNIAKQPRVLICDDEPGNYRKLRRYLSREGFDVAPRVFSEANLEGALEEANRDRRWFQFVMIDVHLGDNMPSGIDLYHRVSYRFPHEEYIVYSSANIETFRYEISNLAYRDVQLVLLDEMLRHDTIHLHMARLSSARDPATVFLVHGRHRIKTHKMRHFLTSGLRLNVIEWETARERVSTGSPHIYEIVIKGIELSHATVVLFTDEEEASLLPSFRGADDPEARSPNYSRRQSRPNVYIEAGYAMGIRPRRTVFVEWPSSRNFFSLPSDFSGIHTVRFSDNESGRRLLRRRLEAARCICSASRNWLGMGLTK